MLFLSVRLLMGIGNIIKVTIMTIAVSTGLLVVLLLGMKIYAEDLPPTPEQAPAAAAPADAAAPAAALPTTDAASNVAPAPAAAPVAPPSWPDTVQIDKAGDIIVGKYEKLKRDLYTQSQKIIDQAAEIITSLDGFSKQSFDDFVKNKKSTEEFLMKTESTLGKLKKTP